MITLENIGYEIAGRWLYRNASLQLKPGDRIGLIGRNGSGKTTLLQLLRGKVPPSEGNLNQFKGLTIGYLDQNMQEISTSKSAFEVAMEAFSEAKEIELAIEKLLRRMEQDNDPGLITEHARLQQRFEAVGGYNLEAEAHTVLGGLGFSEADQQKPFNTFSGGWRMRVLLAKILLQSPNLLLLDEPTNHLDLPAIQWLEQYLKSFQGAFVVVSHDRWFLDKLVTQILEIEHQKFTFYKGNYSFYLTEKALRQELLTSQYENQQKKIAETEQFINRFRAKASKAKQVQSKIKLLEKMERIQAPEAAEATIRFKLTPRIQPGKIIANLNIHVKSYGEKPILKNSEVEITRGQKIGLIGPNGIGKSTVLRILDQQEPFEGTLSYGHKVARSTFAQHQLDNLNPSNTIFEELRGFARDKTDLEIRNILGGFLFSGDEIEKPIRVLSGGEKARVALAKTLLSEANFLLLDEPTNHLDLVSIDMLTQALKEYEGTFIIVSHDQFFLRQAAEQVWYIDAQQLKSFPGNYEEFQYKKDKQTKIVAPPSVKQKQKIEQISPPETSDYHAEKKRKNRIRKLEKDLSKAESSLEILEKKKAEQEALMAKPEMAANFSKLMEAEQELQKVRQDIEEKMAIWEEIASELDALQNSSK